MYLRFYELFSSLPKEDANNEFNRLPKSLQNALLYGVIKEIECLQECDKETQDLASTEVNSVMRITKYILENYELGALQPLGYERLRWFDKLFFGVQEKANELQNKEIEMQNNADKYVNNARFIIENSKETFAEIAVEDIQAIKEIELSQCILNEALNKNLYIQRTSKEILGQIKKLYEEIEKCKTAREKLPS
jgi:hypothetical protein